MNITTNKKKQEKKQELNNDPLVDGIVKTREYVAKNNKMIIGVSVVLLFAIVFSVVFGNMRASSDHKSQEVFGNAMLAYTASEYDKAIEQFKIVTDNYGTTVQAVFSSYMLGNILFGQKRYDEAITWFENAISSKKASGFVGAQAFEGLALCYEAKGDNAAAVKYLENALNDDRISFRHGAIRWKLALLSKSDVPKVRKLCTEIINDTTATDLHQKAENLLAMQK